VPAARGCVADCFVRRRRCIVNHIVSKRNYFLSQAVAANRTAIIQSSVYFRLRQTNPESEIVISILWTPGPGEGRVRSISYKRSLPLDEQSNISDSTAAR